MAEPQLKPREVKIRVHDGVEIAVALYMPDGDGRFPIVLGASPYRYDNNALPATPQFLWRETGPCLCADGRARLRQIGRRIPFPRPQ